MIAPPSSPVAPARPVVLIVDDTPFNIDVLRGALSGLYTVKAATSGERALLLAAAHPQPDLILLDVMMPGMDGYEVCQKLKAQPHTQAIPVVFVTSMNEVADEQRGFAVGGVDYITKPVSPPLVQARVATHLRLYAHERRLTQLVRERTIELEDTRLEIIRRLGRAAEFKDDETGAHVIRMSHYARILAQAAGLCDEDVNIIFNAAPMHDIGKIGIPERVLQKRGPLDADEWAIMTRHPSIGAGIIGRHKNTLLDTARVVALSHHEHYDGKGYPRKLVGEAIPLAGRIVAVADVFDALTSERPYKSAWSLEKTVAYMQEQAGQYFDPRLVQLFIQHLPEVQAVQKIYTEDSVNPEEASS